MRLRIRPQHDVGARPGSPFQPSANLLLVAACLHCRITAMNAQPPSAIVCPQPSASPWAVTALGRLMLRSCLVLGLSLALQFSATAGVSVEKLRCEYLDNPLGIDTPQPRLSWVLDSKQRAEKQTAYQILAASSEALLKSDSGDLWDSGKVASDQTLHVVYAGKALGSCQRCYWKVRVWDKDGKASAYSRPASLGDGAARLRRIGRASGSAARPTPIPCPLPCSAAHSRWMARSSRPAPTSAGSVTTSCTSTARRSATICSTPATRAMTNARSTSPTMSPTPCAAGRTPSA